MTNIASQRAALTRAIKSNNPALVLEACRKAVRAWSEPGAHWPDDWSRWQRALDDVYPVFESPRLEDL